MVHMDKNQHNEGVPCFFPQVYHLHALHAQFPDAILALPTRPAEHWLASISKWGDMHQRLVQYCGLPGLNADGRTREEHDALLLQFYDNHTRLVRQPPRAP